MGGESTTVGHLDPICGKQIKPDARTALSAEYKKRRYYFCSESCRCAFERRAEKIRMNELAQAGSLFHPSRVRWGRA